MLNSKNQTLEDLLVENLSQGARTAKNLLLEVEKCGEDYSIQAVYKILRQLISSEVVVKHSTQYSLSREWVQKTTNLLRRNLLLEDLSPGESLSYEFRSPPHLDSYWKHIAISLQDFYGQYPLFIFNAHEFWFYMIGRAQSEMEYLESFLQKKSFGFFVIGGNTKLDKEFKKMFQTEYFHIDLNPKIPFRRTDHVTAIGDHVITVRFSTKLADYVDKLYNQAEGVENLSIKLNNMLTISNRFRFKLENNPKKARELRKKLAKNFYIPKELIEKYDLF